jgi:uncharacterized protein YjbI with pentapeptide repeats
MPSKVLYWLTHGYVSEFNAHREQHPDTEIDLEGFVFGAGVDLSGINLSGVNLRHARLDGLTLCRADFTGADLSYATLCASDLSFAEMRSAVLWNTGWNRSTVLRGTKLPRHCKALSVDEPSTAQEDLDQVLSLALLLSLDMYAVANGLPPVTRYLS